MKTVIDELVTVLGVELDPKAKPNIKFSLDAFDGIGRMAKWAGAALIAAASAIAYFAKQNAEAAAEIQKLSELTRIGTDTIQELSYAAIAAGGSSQSLQGDLLNLTKTMSSPIPGEFNHALFMMGVDIKKANGQLKTADEILLDVSDKFRNMSKIEQVQWASKIGISDDTLYMLRMGRGEIERLKKQAQDLPVIVDEKSLKMAREFTIQTGLMKTMISGLGQSIAAAAGPVMTQMVKDFSEFIKANKELIQLKIQDVIHGVVLGFRQFGEMIRSARDYIYGLFPGMQGFLSRLTEVDMIADTVTTTLTLLFGAIALSNPHWVALAAVIGAVSLVVNDVLGYFRGMDSVTGDVISKITEMTSKFQADFPNITRLAKDLWQMFKYISEIAWDTMITGISNFSKGLGLALSLIEKLLSLTAKYADTKIGGVYGLNELTSGFMPSVTNLGINDILSKIAGSGGGGSSFNVTQNISSPNPVAAGQESANMLRYLMPNLYQGDFSAMAQ